MPVIVEHRVLWTDVATVFVTALLVLAAVAAFLQVERQIRQARKQHRDELRAILRPIVVVPHAEGRTLPGQEVGIQFKAWLQNVGPGPALNVELRAWPRIPTKVWTDPAGRMNEIEELKTRIGIDDPELSARVGALAAGDPPRAAPLIPIRHVAAEDYPGRKGILIYTVLYQDTFEERYPSKPKTEWKVGHVEVTPEGTWRT
ncbi:MAG: hypothetical protein HYS09_09810 [Chloroflexi bacterium]|nr:hypothetical protein [Chloroflexota bacterium]